VVDIITLGAMSYAWKQRWTLLHCGVDNTHNIITVLHGLLASQIMAANMDADSVSLIISLHKILESVINKTDITPQGQISEKKLQKPR
jgi:hypothetical protein